nr:AraC family ligand binding domain-containing protein [Pyrinomonadaceae bacterium]
HVWPFDSSFAVDVRFFIFDKRHNIRMNRHDYFEIFYVHSGETICRIQNRSFPISAGDLVVISSTQYHTMYPPIERDARTTVKAAALYFLPELIRAAETNGDDAEYLMPFLVQDAGFSHIIKAETGIPNQVFDLIKRINTELPTASTRARLAVKTYLKMVLILLVNHYAEYQGTGRYSTANSAPSNTFARSSNSSKITTAKRSPSEPRPRLSAAASRIS